MATHVLANQIVVSLSFCDFIPCLCLLEEFKRAVKAVTGHNLNPHLVHIVFQLFDSDGDGHLSHKEFISVMKDRLHRGFRVSWQRSNKEEDKGVMRTAVTVQRLARHSSNCLRTQAQYMNA